VSWLGPSQLTAVLNRRGFDERFELERRRAARTSEPLSLLVADLDHFKAINDARGHAGGDVVLQRCAELIQASCREVDAVARTGGEEFAILMPGTDEDNAFDAAERIRRALEEDARTNGGVTVSIGVSQLASAEETADELTKRTDDALYAAKDAGRNRTMRAAPAIG
jgi:two-component system, cell cycle response regulator